MNQQEALDHARDLIVEMRAYMDRLGQQGIRERVDAFLAATAPEKFEPDRVADGGETIGERERFECSIFISGQSSKFGFDKYANGKYLSVTFQSQWEGWQARAALAQPTVKDALQVADGWLPIESAPPEGQFLVYMPDEKRMPIQMAKWHPNIKAIGGAFAFDLPPVTHYHPLPSPPAQSEDEK